MIPKQVLLLCLVCVTATAIASSDDKFIKKYAMMKIYESCFGSEVVKQIRQEMKEAYAKCSAPPSFEPPMNSQTPQQVLLGRLPPGFTIDPNTQSITKAGDGASGLPNQELDLSDTQDRVPPKAPPSVMGFRPQQNPSFQQAVPPYMMGMSNLGSMGNMGSMGSLNPQYRPFTPAAPFYQFPYSNSYFPQYNPYFPQQQYQQGYYQQQQPYYGSQRSSRDMEFRDRLDVISRTPPSSKVRNITCVMQELGYVDHRLEPNYDKITERISNLPVSSELKGDIQDGLQFCQKFSQCVPDIKRNVAPLSQELIKPMFFFRCYKHKKLEACIMKDVRERFTTEEELEAETDFRSLGRSARSTRDFNLHDPRFEALDEMAVYMYDYLSGGSGLDFDLFD